MTVGVIKTRHNCKKDILILEDVVDNVVPPSAPTDGVPMYEVSKLGQGSTLFEDGANFPNQPTSKHRLCIRGTVDASETLVGTFTLWGWLESAQDWFPVKVNGGSALAESTADKICYTEVFDYLSAFDRIAISLASIGGTGATFSAWLVTCQESY